MAGHDVSTPDFERVRSLGAMMQRRVGDPRLDAQDARLLQLLLDEYTGAVRQVRAAAQAVDTTLNDVGSAMREGRRVVRRARANDAAADAG
jgi:hypothetical protein